MNITKSRSELVREAADKLSIVGTGQPLEAEYAEQIDRSVDPLLIQLAADDICSVASDEYIPSEWFDPIAGLLANICAPLGGKSFDPQIAEYYRAQLKRLTSSKPAYPVLEGIYY